MCDTHIILVCVCVCVCVRARARTCVCVYDCVSVCACVFVGKRMYACAVSSGSVRVLVPMSAKSKAVCVFWRWTLNWCELQTEGYLYFTLANNERKKNFQQDVYESWGKMN